MQEMSQDDQHNTAKEGKVCDVVRIRLRNVLEGREVRAGVWSTARDKEK